MIRWYALHTQARHEKQVLKYLQVNNVSALLPTYMSVRRWKNRTTQTLELPIFPGYLFARFSLENRLPVICAPGVISLVGAGQYPTPIDDAEVDLLTNRIRQLDPMPYPYMKIGDQVRVKTGPLAGTVGILVRQKQNLRLVISMNLIMQSVSVEVDAWDIEPVSTNTRPVSPQRVLYVPPQHRRVSPAVSGD